MALLGQDKLSKKLHKTIAEYENMIEKDNFTSVQEKNDTRKLLRTLKAQLDHHINNKEEKKAVDESIEERREKALQDIFTFYAKQHIPPGLPFEELEETLKTIQVGELLVFCKDFKVDVPRNDLMLLYKRESENNMPHKIKQFKQCLRKIADLLHGKKLQELSTKIQALKKTLGIKSEKASDDESKSGSGSSSGSGSDNEGEGSDHEKDDKSEKKSEKSSVVNKKEAAPTKSKVVKPPVKGKNNVKAKGKNVKEEEKSEVSVKESKKSAKESKKSVKESKKSDASDDEKSGSESGSDKSGSSSSSDDDKEKSDSESVVQNRLTEEKNKLEEEFEELSSKTKDEVYEEFLLYLQIDHPAEYKKKAKGLRLAFDVKDTKSRIPIGLSGGTMKRTFKRGKMSAADIKDKVQKMKEEREHKKFEQDAAVKFKYEKNRETLKHIHEKLRHEKQKPVGNKISYSDIKVRNMGIPTWDDKHTKVTLDVLKNMHYSDFNINDDDDFKPTDVMDDDEIKEMEKNEKRRNIKNNSIQKVSVRELAPEEFKQKAKRGVQMNQSQMAEYRNKSSFDVTKGSTKPINQAYDYTQGGLKAHPSKKDIYIKSRDERSVPKLHQSLDGDYALNARDQSFKYPGSKQATISKRIAIGGSPGLAKQNKSVHYRRQTHGNYSMNINDSYQMGANTSKLPGMKKQMNERAKQIESTSRAKERHNMDSVMLMHKNQISKGLKAVDKSRYK